MSEPPSIDKQLLVLKLIVAMTIAGLVAFLGVVMAVGRNLDLHPEFVRPLMAALLVVALAATLLPMLLCRPFVNRARLALAKAPEHTDSDRIAMSAFLPSTLIELAGAELLGFLAVAGFMLTQERMALWAGALALVLLVRQFPTQGRWEQFRADVESAGEA